MKRSCILHILYAICLLQCTPLLAKKSSEKHDKKQKKTMTATIGSKVRGALAKRALIKRSIEAMPEELHIENATRKPLAKSSKKADVRKPSSKKHHSSSHSESRITKKDLALLQCKIENELKRYFAVLLAGIDCRLKHVEKCCEQKDEHCNNHQWNDCGANHSHFCNDKDSCHHHYDDRDDCYCGDDHGCHQCGHHDDHGCHQGHHGCHDSHCC